jgi:hypothetical protein
MRIILPTVGRSIGFNRSSFFNDYMHLKMTAPKKILSHGESGAIPTSTLDYSRLVFNQPAKLLTLLTTHFLVGIFTTGPHNWNENYRLFS